MGEPGAPPRAPTADGEGGRRERERALRLSPLRLRVEERGEALFPGVALIAGAWPGGAFRVPQTGHKLTRGSIIVLAFV